MTCTPGVNQVTVTVQAPVANKPTVSGFTATARNDIGGSIDLKWTQDIAGSVQLFINGSAANVFSGTVGSNTKILSGFNPGTFTLCMDAV